MMVIMTMTAPIPVRGWFVCLSPQAFLNDESYLTSAAAALKTTVATGEKLEQSLKTNREVFFAVTTTQGAMGSFCW